jgi:purine-cytosine permease-like protein
VLYSVPLAFGGVRVFLDKFNGFLFPLYVVGLAAAVIWAVAKFDVGTHWLTQRPTTLPVSGPGWWWAFTVYMGDWVLMMATWDYARFARTGRKDIRINGWLTFGPGFYFFTIVINGLVGIFVALTIPTKGQLSELSGVLGMVNLMGIVGVVFVWVSQTRINTANFYLATTNLENFCARTFKFKLPRVAWAIIVGVIVFLIMLSNVFSFLLAALRYQSVLAVAWTSCVLSYIAWGRFRGRLAEQAEWRPGRVPLFNWGGLLAWGTGAAVGVVMLSMDSASSWESTWALPVAFVVSAVVEVTVLALARPTAAVMRRPHDPRDEVDDVWEARIRCYRCGKSYIALEMDRDPSHGNQPICASDAQASPTFYHHVRQDAARAPGVDEAAAESRAQ